MTGLFEVGSTKVGTGCAIDVIGNEDRQRVLKLPAESKCTAAAIDPLLFGRYR